MHVYLQLLAINTRQNSHGRDFKCEIEASHWHKRSQNFYLLKLAKALLILPTFFSLPVGTAVKLLLRKKNMVGCLSNLYGSIGNLNETYTQQNQIKNSVLNPKSF